MLTYDTGPGHDQAQYQVLDLWNYENARIGKIYKLPQVLFEGEIYLVGLKPSLKRLFLFSSYF